MRRTINGGHVGGYRPSSTLAPKGSPLVKLSDYLQVDAAPMARHYATPSLKLNWWGNNAAGDCTYAALYDRRQLLASLTGEAFTAADPAAPFHDYEVGTGWDGVPGSATDKGNMPISVLNQAATVGVAGEVIVAYGLVDHTNRTAMEQAIDLFCCAYVAGNLPSKIDSEPAIWDEPPVDQWTAADHPDPDGGHAWLYAGYDHETFDVLTWTRQFIATNAFHQAVVLEAWIVIDDALVRGDRPAPNGFNLARLQADLAAIKAAA